ncbi:MAG: hypothetical protein ISR61_09925 [Desulfobacteraceae bacterium]|uniref:Uncharacterized protein n=1 Tax=Candidatus Desulfacyla euxinica TaxID=2841693 RepID=A0A8J6N0B6_9DELT|nr:hypothetical protein [Candidatus Desulfacyla euxinica]MBL6979258.1 hypothetical protein [Desulfobacteraceae bacterium]MBL7216333.1 hypothetical protein [Desulfobacteraceae bacterium]
MDREKATVKALEQQGWTKQFVTNEPRLSEAVKMYKEAGFQVHLEPLPPQRKHPVEEKCELDADCRQCFEGFEDQHKIIFTRRLSENERFFARSRKAKILTARIH